MVVPLHLPVYIDESNIMARPVRLRKQRTLFAFTDTAKSKQVNRDPLGLSLLGTSFWDADGDEQPKQYTVLRTGDPRKFMDGTIPVPILEYKESAHLKDPEYTTHETPVTEIRRWIKTTKHHLATAADGEDIGDAEAEAVLSPLLAMGPATVDELQDVEQVDRKKRLKILLTKLSTSRKSKRFTNGKI
jgi:hypothetical protein